MGSLDYSALAIEAVKELSPGAEKVGVIFRYPKYLNGKLFVVQLAIQDRTFENFVYFEGDSKQPKWVAKQTPHLIELSNQSYAGSAIIRWLREAGNVASVIAVIVTIAIVAYIFLNPEKHVPDILANALTTILGFYFGSKVGGRNNDA